MLVKPVTVSAGNIFVMHFSILVLLLSLFGIVPIKGNRYADLRILAIALQIPENSHISVRNPGLVVMDYCQRAGKCQPIGT